MGKMKFQVQQRSGYKNFETLDKALKYAKSMSARYWVTYRVNSIEYECHLYECKNGRVYPVKNPLEHHAYINR